MGWGEAHRLTQQLLTDPSSHVSVAVLGWQRAWTPEAFVLADLFDLLHKVNSKRQPRAYPRPTDPAPKRLGRATRPQRDIRAALRATGPQMKG